MAPAQGSYPAGFTFDPPERVANWRPLVHWLLAIPHLAIVYVLGTVSEVVSVISWFAILFPGGLAAGLATFQVMYLRYSLRTATYVGFLREEYPPFTFVTTAPDPGDDPRVSVDLVPALEKSAGDVAAHVVGGMTDIVAGRLEGLGTPEVTERQVVERRGRTPDEVADELAATRKASVDLLATFDDAACGMPSPAGFDSTLGEGVESLWYDAVLHADDIRAATGRASAASADGLAASVSHIAMVLGDRGWGPACLALDGLPEFPVGDEGGRRVTGDPLAFVLVATGRADPASFDLDDSVKHLSLSGVTRRLG